MVEKPTQTGLIADHGSDMKTLLRLEELGMMALGILLYATLDYPWWIFAVLILVPDLSMVAYVINNRLGALVYNIFHHKGIAIGLYLAALWMDSNPLMLTGIILFTHASMDRIFGYGLKFSDDFKHTHLGRIGKRTTTNP